MTLDCYYLGTRLPFGSIRTSPCASISWDFLLKSTASARRTIEPFSQPLSRHIDSSTSPLSRRTESVSALRLRRGTWVNTYRVDRVGSCSHLASLLFAISPARISDEKADDDRSHAPFSPYLPKPRASSKMKAQGNAFLLIPMIRWDQLCAAILSTHPGHAKTVYLGVRLGILLPRLARSKNTFPRKSIRTEISPLPEQKDLPQGLKPDIFSFTARLNSCPDTTKLAAA